MSLALDHVLNPDHDALKHPTVFEGADGAFFCVHCAAQRQVREPKRRIMFADKATAGSIQRAGRNHTVDRNRSKGRRPSSSAATSERCA